MQEVTVQVAVRVRPLLPKEKLEGEQICVRILPSTNQLVIGKDRAFSFNYVLPSKISQKQLYERCVESLVKSCLEGYNATVFAYGQTGSGKTFTMGGGSLLNQTDDDVGIMPRAVQQVFELIAGNTNREYTVRVSYVEIYKEELYDLLDLDNDSKDLHIREDSKGNTVIAGVLEVECETVDDVMSYLERGSSYRHTGLTRMNEHSSRSHSVFTLVIEQRWSDGNDSQTAASVQGKTRRKSDATEEIIDEMADFEHYMCAKFHFVDLAGSERADRTGNVGERFKESVHINGGLLALGNVISALGDTKKRATLAHIPYRESKITRLLKDSLGGNAKTLMICCISPSSANFGESLNSLKYAYRARKIRNKPVINRDPQSLRFEEMESEIRALREELRRQRSSVYSSSACDDGMLQTTRLPADPEQNRELENRLEQLKTECAHYCTVTDEAYQLLTDMRDRDALSQSQSSRLCDWLELVDEMKNNVPVTLNKDVWDNKTILKLETELQKCKDDLKNDEEIFAERLQKQSDMQEMIDRLERDNADLILQLEEAQEKINQLNEQVLTKQLELNANAARIQHKSGSSARTSTSIVASAGFGTDVTSKSSPNLGMSRPRAVSVQVQRSTAERARKNNRNIHSSPATFNIDRVVHCFRARSALLVSRLEDDDEVLHKTFSDPEDKDDADDENGVGYMPSYADEPVFSRVDKKRATYRVKESVRLNRPSVEPNRIRKHDAGHASLNSDVPADSAWAVKRNSTQVLQLGRSCPVDDNSENISRLTASSEQHKRQLRSNQLDVKKSERRIKDLTINIRYKEQLIKQLLKNGHEAEQMNKQYDAQLRAVEDEKSAAQNELTSLQKAYDELVTRERSDKQQTQQLQIEFRKKMEAAKARVHALKKKQKEAERSVEVVNVAQYSNKRVQELETAIANMRRQQEQLVRHMKTASDQKSKLEREIQREQQKVRELEMSSERQKKILRVKMDEMSVMQRRLRSAGLPVTAAQTPAEVNRLEEQKRVLDQEMEMVLHQRKAAEELERDLKQREQIVARKEAMLSEKRELEMKKLRSSQVLSKDMLQASSRLESVERQMEEKTREISELPSARHAELTAELDALHRARDQLSVECTTLQSKMTDDLSDSESKRLVELEEQLDAMDAAIEFKNESIANRQHDLRRSMVRMSVAIGKSGQGPVKLQSLSVTEMRSLVGRYFDRVVDLRDGQRRLRIQHAELEMKADEQMVRVAELESCVEKATMEADRRLTQQQQEYEKRIELLMKQVTQAETAGPPDVMAQLKSKESRIVELEKDLYYYKMTSRELRKKLRSMNRDGGLSEHDNKDSYAEPPSTHRDIAASGDADAQSQVNGKNTEHVDTPRDIQHKSDAKSDASSAIEARYSAASIHAPASSRLNISRSREPAGVEVSSVGVGPAVEPQSVLSYVDTARDAVLTARLPSEQSIAENMQSRVSPSESSHVSVATRHSHMQSSVKQSVTYETSRPTSASHSDRAKTPRNVAASSISEGRQGSEVTAASQSKLQRQMNKDKDIASRRSAVRSRHGADNESTMFADSLDETD